MKGETEKDTQALGELDQLPAKGKRKTVRKGMKGVHLKKVKVTYYLTTQAIEKVGVAATMEHRDKSEIVERLIQDHLKEWVVSYRGQRADESDGEGRGAE